MPTPRFFAKPQAFRRWLKDHHAEATELWVGYHKVDAGIASMTWPESVDEALCFGWIDGLRRGLDDTSYMIRFTPRKADSHWSKRNIDRVEVLRAEARMTAAGEAAYKNRSAELSGRATYEREDALTLGAEEEREFRTFASGVGWAFWCDQPPGYRRSVSAWVMGAKRADTRTRRLAAVMRTHAKKRRLNLTRPFDN